MDKEIYGEERNSINVFRQFTLLRNGDVPYSQGALAIHHSNDESKTNAFDQSHP